MQDGLDLDPDALGRAAAGHAPKRILVLALADNFKVVASVEERDIGDRWRHDERWHRRRCTTVGAGTAVQNAVKQAHERVVILRE